MPDPLEALHLAIGPSLAVTGFKTNIAVKRPLLEALYEAIPSAKAAADEMEPEIAAWLDADTTLDAFLADADRKERLWFAGANRALHTDAGSAMILLVAAEIERLHMTIGESLFDKGVDTYIPGVKTARAIQALANQYKHLGEWRRDRDRGGDRDIVAKLVDDPLRADAASTFIMRGYPSYDAFEEAVMACADGIVTDGTIPVAGRAGIPRITRVMSAAKDDNHS